MNIKVVMQDNYKQVNKLKKKIKNKDKVLHYNLLMHSLLKKNGKKQ